jgi:iron complex transport system ATP-binding protein
MSCPLLKLSAVSLVIQRRAILKDLNLTIAHGEKVAVVGANGAGKSSVLKVLAGLYRSHKGSVFVDGAEVRGIEPRALSHLVSLVPQRLEFVPRFRVREFFEMSGLVNMTGVDPAIPSLLDRYLPDLSGGELQRVVLAGAVAQGARLLLLDEPTAHLDPTGRSEVERVISEYHKQQNISYLLVTHDLSLATRAAERVVVMKDGCVMWDGSTNDAIVPEILQQAYGCSFSRIVHPKTGESLIIAG